MPNNDFDLKQNLSKFDNFFLYQNKFIDSKKFIHDINHIASHLQNHKYIINLCQDRYLFAVLFFASTLKKNINLLPAFKKKKFLNQVIKQYKNSIIFYDDDIVNLLNQKSKNTENNLNWVIKGKQNIVILFTSGTTGKPKPICHNLSFMMSRAYLATQSLKIHNKKYLILSTVVPQHMYGLETCIFWPLISEFICHSHRFIYMADIQKICEESKLSIILISTPFNLKTYLKNSFLPKNIIEVISATDKLELSLSCEIEKKFNTRVSEIYGSTETASVAYRYPTKDEIYQCYPGLQIKKHEDSSFILLDEYNNITIAMGDNLQLKNNTNFKIISRIDDLLKVAGNRISASFLQTKLLKISYVDDGVFFQNSTNHLDLMVASTLSSTTIKQKLTTELDPIFLPKKIYFVEKIPRNENGKLDRDKFKVLIFQQQTNFTKKIKINKDLKIFVGHFKNNPILPASIILDYIIESCYEWCHKIKIDKIIQAKFLHTLKPDDDLLVSLEKQQDKIKFICYCKNNIICQGSLLYETS
ncbi:MAG: hypothetical protein DRQ51_08950 [Gammaproteobacteria bacterium]|nr:MAG: hypothetical protein DRQ51_08950 [Gammaproteobacteria bacterium]